ncbi:MAG: TIGR02646 family protein [Deltaproteobacteria bacterium]|nr:MAG: TIGR02646 family protein [Deltaproteobacteria bacterium]
MIKIQRASAPEVLADSPSEGMHYNKKEVVERLWEMQHGKCCYCEQRIPDEGHLKAVEHFRPKSVFRNLKNEWKNLLLSCAQCNGKKSDKFPVILSDTSGESETLYPETASRETPAVIDPSDPEINPEDHISFDFSGGDTSYEEYGIIMARHGSLMGQITIETVGLDRMFYAKKRYDYYVYIIMQDFRNLLIALSQGNERDLESCKRTFRQLMSAKGEFAAFTRAFVRHKKLDRPPVGIRIPVGSEI